MTALVTIGALCFLFWAWLAVGPWVTRAIAAFEYHHYHKPAEFKLQSVAGAGDGVDSAIGLQYNYHSTRDLSTSLNDFQNSLEGQGCTISANDPGFTAGCGNLNLEVEVEPPSPTITVIASTRSY